VGSDLFAVDSDSSVSLAANVPLTTSAIPSSSVTPPVKDIEDHSRGRTPSIKFIGKRSLIKEDIAVPAVAVATIPLATSKTSILAIPPVKIVKPSGKAVDFSSLKGGAWYGRPLISEAEAEAIASGGASVISPDTMKASPKKDDKKKK